VLGSARHGGRRKGWQEVRVSDIKLHKVPRRWPLVLIALDKLAKAVGCVFLSIVLRMMLSVDRHQELIDWLRNERLSPHNWVMVRFFKWVEVALGFPDRTLRLFHIGVIIYAGLYLIEGVGLLYETKWAEWMVVITTAMFLPVEVYELFRDPTMPLFILFVINLIIVVYLAWRLHRQAVVERERAEHPELVAK
jgi:uncharacterized membrane protein (DUF2068 family)